LNYPEETEGVILEIIGVDEQIKRRRSSIKALEQQITLDACSAKDEAGKPVLKNEREREAAIATMLSESEKYSETATELGNFEQDKRRLEARLERLRMEFRQEMQANQYRNDLAALRLADAIYAARNYTVTVPPAYSRGSGYLSQVEPEIDFGF
jgi:hypothetical protein